MWLKIALTFVQTDNSIAAKIIRVSENILRLQGADSEKLKKESVIFYCKPSALHGRSLLFNMSQGEIEVTST